MNERRTKITQRSFAALMDCAGSHGGLLRAAAYPPSTGPAAAHRPRGIHA